MRKKYLATKNRAFTRGLDFNISYEYFRQLKLADCHYCGTPNMLLSHYCEVMGYKTPWMTIDRTDNSRGYVIGNVVSSCFICKRIKNNFFTHYEMKKNKKNFVSPKMKKFEQEAFDSFSDWCSTNVFLEDDLDPDIEIIEIDL